MNESDAKTTPTRSDLREAHGDAECCRLRDTWTMKWEEAHRKLIVSGREEIVTMLDQDILMEMPSDDDEITVTIRYHKQLTQHEIDALPEFGGW